MVAVGSYLRERRQLENLTRIEVAHATGTNESQVLRIENGEIDTRGSLLLSIVDTVKGNAEIVKRLIRDKTATAEDGYEAAHDPEYILKATALIAAASDEQRQKALKIIQQLKSDPKGLELWFALGEQLGSARSAQDSEEAPQVDSDHQ